MKLFYTFTLLLLANISFAQDIDFFHKNKNDNYKMPLIDSAMTFTEFKLLSENLRMMDMVNAAVVPGYIHFKTGEKKIAYSLLGLRLVSYATISALYFDDDIEISGWDIILANSKSGESVQKYKNIYAAAFMIAASTYLFDWIRGSHILSKKQEQIRYKYSLKMSLQNYSGALGGSFQKKAIPSVSVGFRF